MAQDLSPNTLLNDVNTARQQPRNCGDEFFSAAPPLRWNPKLGEAARKHSVDMANNNYFSHTSLNGDKVEDRIGREGYDLVNLDENVSVGDKEHSNAVEGWLKSPGHCRNIMSPDYVDFGAGYGVNVDSRFEHYWIQVFATPTDNEPAPPPINNEPAPVGNEPLTTNINNVRFEGGSFRQINSTTWVETDAQGNTKFTLEEVKRDEQIVYIRDNSRGISLQLDLFEIGIEDDSGAVSALYDILP